MHELSLATSLLETVLGVLPPEAPRVVEARVVLGVLTAVEPESLAFAFSVVARGTPAEGCRIVFERVPVRIRCRAGCGEAPVAAPSGHGDPFLLDALLAGGLSCPSCGGASEVVGGREIRLSSIGVEDGRGEAPGDRTGTDGNTGNGKDEEEFDA